MNKKPATLTFLSKVGGQLTAKNRPTVIINQRLQYARLLPFGYCH